MNEIIEEQHDGVVVLTLNRPRSLNALTIPMADHLADVLDRLNDDQSVRVVVITGAGSAFCSGLDLKENEIGDAKRRPPYRMLEFHAHQIGRIRAFSKPTVAAVNGVAVGGGLGLALACDIRIASEDAKFSAIFAKIGMPVQDVVGAFLPQAVGLSRALEMIYTARMVGGREAERIGLVSETVGADDLMARTMELAGQIAAGPPMALAMSKQVVYRGLGKSQDDQLAYQALGTLLNASFASHDVVEAVEAFRHKRSPIFRGP
jgi:2-(1,2-epoxy-1,2-dihydrophenyl)acetyl-CoA isomerase